MYISIFSDELYKDIYDVLPILKEWGMTHVDFRGMINGKTIENQTDEELHALKAALDEYGLKPGVIQSSLCKVHLPDAERQAKEMAKLDLPGFGIGGLSVGEDGATHQCIEDMALMRAIPGMMVLCPCDGPEMRLAVKALMEYDGPAYLRLGRLAVDSVTDSVPGYEFKLGKGVTLRDGTPVAPPEADELYSLFA